MNNSRSFPYRHCTLETVCREAAQQFPVLLVTGPRQVGKTRLS